MSHTTPSHLEILRKVPFFKDLPLIALQALVLESSLVNYQKDEVIVKRGQTYEYLSVLVEGQISISVTNKAGRRHILSQFNTGQLYGLNPVIDQQPLFYESTASLPCQLLRIPREPLMQAMQAHPALFHAILLVMCQRSRDSFAALAAHRLLSTRARLAQYLLIIARQNQSTDEAAEPYTLAYSQNDLAEMLGVSRQTLNTEIGALEKLGLLRKQYAKIELVDLIRLEQLIRTEI